MVLALKCNGLFKFLLECNRVFKFWM